MAGEGTDRCGRAREWASLRADGELSELERLLLRRHLSRCESCRTFAEELTATTQLLRTAPVERPSRALVPEVRPLRRRRRVRYRVALAGALVAVAAATGGIVGSIVGSGGSGPAPTQPRRDIALRPNTSTVPIPTPATPPGENV